LEEIKKKEKEKYLCFFIEIVPQRSALLEEKSEEVGRNWMENLD
jgi:hypothetical protein